MILVWNKNSLHAMVDFWLSPKPTEIGEWIVGDLGYHNGYQFVIPKQSGPRWLHEMTSMATARHETINSRMKVWAIWTNIDRTCTNGCCATSEQPKRLPML
jgi:hypothetical protein